MNPGPAQRILYIPFDQLHRDYGVLKIADKATDVIAMIESQAMLGMRKIDLAAMKAAYLAN